MVIAKQKPMLPQPPSRRPGCRHLASQWSQPSKLSPEVQPSRWAAGTRLHRPRPTVLSVRRTAVTNPDWFLVLRRPPTPTVEEGARAYKHLWFGSSPPVELPRPLHHACYQTCTPGEQNGSTIYAPLPWCAATSGVRKSHCHVFLRGLDPGQTPFKTLLLMLRLTKYFYLSFEA